MKPMNWVRTNGNPMPFHPKIDPELCASTMPCRLIVPACTTTPTTARRSGSSYAMSCAAARSAPSSENLLALAHPAMSTPITDKLDTASA